MISKIKEFKRKGKKAQIITSDFFIALGIMLISLLALFGVWQYQISRFNNRIAFEDLQIRTLQTNKILFSSGEPNNWNSSNVKILGLAESERHISSKKLSRLNETNYNYTKDVLGIEGYEYSILIKNLQNTTLASYGNPNPQKDVVNLRRIILYEGQISIFELKMWRST